MNNIIISHFNENLEWFYTLKGNFNKIIYSKTIKDDSKFHIPVNKSQEVPMYKWESKETSSIFGNDENDWYTDLDTASGMFSTKYQGMDFNQTPYFWADNGPNTGYLFNYDSNGVTPNPSWPAGNSTKSVVGAPYHFYFGLNKGKSAINRYITKYVLNQDE